MRYADGRTERVTVHEGAQEHFAQQVGKKMSTAERMEAFDETADKTIVKKSLTRRFVRKIGKIGKFFKK